MQDEPWMVPNMRWMQTFTGKIIDVANPKVEDIDIVDIAHALSRICRYGGHTNTFYSVAAHSLAMATYQADVSEQHEFVLEALLHDAAEAYLGDSISPVRRHLADEARKVVSPLSAANSVTAADDYPGPLERLHAKWNNVIWEKFNLRQDFHDVVSRLDRLALMAEIPLVFKTVSKAFADNGAYPPKPEFASMVELMSKHVSEFKQFDGVPVGSGTSFADIQFIAHFVKWECERKSP